MGKLLIFIGIFLILIGLLLWLAEDKIKWLGHLPGDILIKKPGFVFYMPITTAVLLSLVLSLLIWLVKKII